MTTSTFCEIVTIATGYVRYQHNGTVPEQLIGGAAALLALLLLWMFQFTKDWVRLPADAYAHRLVETIDSFPTKTAAAKSTNG